MGASSPRDLSWKISCLYCRSEVLWLNDLTNFFLFILEASLVALSCLSIHLTGETIIHELGATFSHLNHLLDIFLIVGH